MTAALISTGSTILAILLVSVIRTEGRLTRLEAKLDILMTHMLPSPPQQSSPATAPTQAPVTQPATAPS